MVIKSNVSAGNCDAFLKYFNNNVEELAFEMKKFLGTEEVYFNPKESDDVMEKNSITTNLCNNLLPGLNELLSKYDIKFLLEDYQPFIEEYDFEFKKIKKSFKGLNNEKVPFEVCGFSKVYRNDDYKEGFKYNNVILMPEAVFYVRVGERVFLDDRLKRRIPASIERGINNNLIYLSHFDSSLGNYSLLEYSALAVHALSYIDFKDKYVLDLGSADGVLSLVASRNGADKIICVDIESEAAGRLEKNLSVNNMNPSDFHFLNMDIRRRELLDLLPADKIEIVLADLGPEYDGTDLAAVILTDYLPNAKVFVGGGYSFRFIKGNNLNYNYPEIIELLEKRGFNNHKKIIEEITRADYESFKEYLALIKETESGCNHSEEPPQRMAFISEKL